MSGLLDYCIHEAQDAFIPERLILDNTIITYEILHDMKVRRGGRRGSFAFKLDMSMAYDRVE